MASITIRGLDEEVKAKIRMRAAKHGRSMEEEARQLLAEAVNAGAHSEEFGLGSQIRGRFAGLGSFELEAASRRSTRKPPALD